MILMDGMHKVNRVFIRLHPVGSASEVPLANELVRACLRHDQHIASQPTRMNYIPRWYPALPIPADTRCIVRCVRSGYEGGR